MIFGAVPIADAEGAILAHSLMQSGLRLKKGRVLGAEDIAAMHAAGLRDVTVARLEDGDVAEDEAAAQLAAALVPDPASVHLRLGRAATGRVNVYAEAAGVAGIKAQAIHAVNAVHPAITVATVPEWQRMGLRGMVATVKIIAYAVPRAALDAACEVGRAALSLQPTVLKRALLIQTTVSEKDNGDKGQAVTAERLDRLGVALGPKTLVAHQEAPLAAALSAAQGAADIVFILTGSATSDVADVAPAALRRAGGVVHHFGMPVDPGNLLFFGDLNGTPVIGLPGCARAPAMNGADWVMERILCGVPISPADIAGMGVGGLLKEIPQRGRLRDS